MTFKQAAALGGHVRRGEHGSLVVFADHFTKTEIDDAGQAIEREIPFMKGYTVFNVEQIEGLPAHYYAKPAPRDRSFIKGQRYVLLSRRENLTDDRRKNLERLLQANARLNVAYLLREQFEQLWDYADPDDARAFFDSWREQLRDQDLKPYEKFAVMIDKHWDGIKAYAQPTGGGAL